MRPLPLLRLIEARKIDHRLAVEALRHASYVEVLDEKGTKMETEKQVLGATHVGFRITRRGKELLEKEKV